MALTSHPILAWTPDCRCCWSGPAWAAHRIVLELTERVPAGPLRRQGLKIAVDDAGSGFSSMRHILRLRPDIIKLDRSLVAGLDSDHAQRALGAAMVTFAQEIGAQIVAECIETVAELATVTRLGMTSAQSYFLGRPSLHPGEWETWKEARISGAACCLRQAIGPPRTAQPLSSQK